MIKSFSDKRTEALYDHGKYKRIDTAIAKKAAKQIDRIRAATKIEDFYFPPSNHFEKLVGYNPIRYSIMVNKQWRISFEWYDGDAHEVLFEDYH